LASRCAFFASVTVWLINELPCGWADSGVATATASTIETAIKAERILGGNLQPPRPERLRAARAGPGSAILRV
jgi:hypothetical protein